VTADELTYVKKQEAAGKISLHHTPYTTINPNTTDTPASPSLTFHMLDTNPNSPHGFVYTQVHTDPHITLNPPSPTTNQHPPHQTSPNNSNFPTPDPPRFNNPNHFSLAIARPKLDFPNFYGEEPINWLR
jgi:hypothetical protein